MPWQTGCRRDWAGCFHWKFQVDAVKFFLRKLACVLPLEWAGFDKYALSNKMENSMPVLYLQKCRLSAVCLSRQCTSTQHPKKMRRTPTPTHVLPHPHPRKRKQNADTAFITCRAKSIVVNWSTSKTRWQVMLLSELHAHVWWRKPPTVLVCSHLCLSGVPLQLFGNQILRSFCTRQAADLSPLPFYFPIFQILIQFSLLCFSAPSPEATCCSGCGTCVHWPWKQILCQKNIRGESISMNSCSISPPHSSSPQSIFLFSWLTPLL